MISSARVASQKGSRNVSLSQRLSSTVARSRSSRRLPTAASASLRTAISRQRFYTTEKVLELRTGKKKADQPKVLYDPTRETENCGVGLIASLKSVPSRDIVEKADEMLVRMAHRGGCGCDPASGDGSGKSLSLLLSLSVLPLFLSRFSLSFPLYSLYTHCILTV
jgi:hypothetical protein